ncbi:helix-turn-helix transcriptional regulator [Jonesiaceae bacterium BS-20]|uniref:Helix-turn-helix transcriptional regulator n=1 Tax=Jonesiaceae bacterium BS-20 TaxID=3120821 RepID=A0AAU7DVQ1_9MICO
MTTTIAEPRTAEMTVDQAIGLTVNQYLFALKMPAVDLARAFNIGRSTVSRKLHGLVSFSPTELLITAKLLGIEISDLMPTWHEKAPESEGGFEGWVPAPFVPGKGHLTPFRSNQNLEPSVP